MKTIIYYLTGTGNSLAIAKKLSEKLPNSELRSLATAFRNGKLDLATDVVGFVFPVYFLGIPLPINSLFEKAAWNDVKYTFAVANFGSLPGNTLYQTARLIAKNGGRLDAGYLVKMPDNYLPIYPVPDVATQNKDFEIMHQKVSTIAADIINKKPAGIEKSKLRVDRYLSSFAYPTVYKFKEMDRNYWITDACNGCGLCAQSCPFDNINMLDNKPHWQHQCQMCMRCIHICPQKSIQYKKSTLKRDRYIQPQINTADLMADGSNYKNTP